MSDKMANDFFECFLLGFTEELSRYRSSEISKHPDRFAQTARSSRCKHTYNDRGETGKYAN